MATYTVEKVENGIATVRYADNSWAQIIITDSMTQEEFDDQAYQFRPKTGASEVPSFLSVGESRTAAKKLDTAFEDETPEWLSNRLNAYGPPESQIEFIVENGIDAWKAEVASIKALYPKP